MSLLLQVSTALREQGRSKPVSPSVPQLRKGRAERPFREDFRRSLSKKPCLIALFVTILREKAHALTSSRVQEWQRNQNRSLQFRLPLLVISDQDSAFTSLKVGISRMRNNVGFKIMLVKESIESILIPTK